ncbi:DinB family protein [Metabacillus sp. FJAT-52054]|uniref:DinB family protein n=1 Tax=Metabacillus sediminis TaxID=3117746 RepID=A0ABZ2NIZ7_9BACI
MFTSRQEFIEEWKQESQATEKILQTLTDESLSQEIAPGYNYLGGLGWHITVALHTMLAQTGLNFQHPPHVETIPESASEIASDYRNTSDSMLKAIQEQWTDETLNETREFFGNEVPVHAVLRTLIQHQAHHRGQMTVLMRQAGLNVPGVYGPSKEEWANMHSLG